MSILVITTGGTIGALPYADPQNPPTICVLPSDGRDIVKIVIGEKFPQVSVRFVSLEPRDSKLIDEPYRENIVTIIAASRERAIMLTHGTDTILDTANFLYSRCEDSFVDKALLITGAMTPILNGEGSDGFLNIAFCLKILTTAAQGLAGVGVVLCDFDPDGSWQPKLFSFKPEKWIKQYASDGRFNRLVARVA